MVDSFKRPMEVAIAGRQQLTSFHGASRRLTSLQAPIMLLQGHEGEIYGGKFSPDGNCLASAGFDMKIMLWNVYGECENFAMLKGHNGAIMELHFSSDSNILCTCSTDKTIRLWDMETGGCIRNLKGHENFVNSCHINRKGPTLICSGCDDGAIKLWDRRVKEAVHSYQNVYQITAVTFNDTSEQIITGGIDNDVKVWDLRKKECSLTLKGHTDTITGLSLSPDGSYVLSNSMDCTARIWDIRPFAPDQRCVKFFQGHQHNFEKNLLRCSWSPDGHRISCGSSDRFVYVWDVQTRRIIFKLPGHQGSVNETSFHPNEHILMSVASDKRIYLGEIE